jgi:hypothetical protein
MTAGFAAVMTAPSFPIHECPRLLGVGNELECFCSNAVEVIVDEAVEDDHRLVGNTSVGVDLLEDFVDVGTLDLFRTFFRFSFSPSAGAAVLEVFLSVFAPSMDLVADLEAVDAGGLPAVEAVLGAIACERAVVMRERAKGIVLNESNEHRRLSNRNLTYQTGLKHRVRLQTKNQPVRKRRTTHEKYNDVHSDIEWLASSSGRMRWIDVWLSREVLLTSRSSQ